MQIKNREEDFWMGIFDLFKRKTKLRDVSPKTKEEFYHKLKAYFQCGVLKEIYNCERFSVCNACNNCYIIFDYEMCEKNGQSYGIVVAQNLLKSIMEDNIRFYYLLDSWSREKITENTVVCSERLLEVMKKERERTEQNGPDINLDYEKMLIMKFQKRNECYERILHC